MGVPGLLASVPAMTEARGMPRSDDAERGVLSAFLQNPAYIADFQENGKAEFFYHVGNRLLAEELFAMHAEGVPVDVVTVSQWLIDRQLMDKIGGPSTLAVLLNFVPTPAHYPYHMGILQDKFTLREALGLAGKITEDCYANEEDLKLMGDLVVGHAKSMERLFQEKDKRKTLKQEVEEMLIDWQDTAEGRKPSGTPMRWAKWNGMLGGLKKAFYLLKAKRGMGKSSLMHDIAMQVSLTPNDPQPAVIVSYEMSVQSILKRCIANRAQIDSKFLFEPDIHKPDVNISRKITTWADRIAESSLHIIYEPNLSMQAIEYRIKKIGPAFFGIDYLQRMPLPKGYTAKELPAAYGNLSRSVFDLRNEMDNSAMILSHVNSDGEGSWSAAMENDADIALMIEDDSIKVTKRRNGEPGGDIPLQLHGSMFRFEES